MRARHIKRRPFAAFFLVALPAVIHAMFAGTYVIDSDGVRRTFAIGPIGTTTVYVFLALVFLAHSGRARSPYSAYTGALLAWMCMMAFTIFLVSQPAGPELSSTRAIADILTPFCYVPFLVFPYLIGSIIGWIYARLRINAAKHEA